MRLLKCLKSLKDTVKELRVLHIKGFVAVFTASLLPKCLPLRVSFNARKRWMSLGVARGYRAVEQGDGKRGSV